MTAAENQHARVQRKMQRSTVGTARVQGSGKCSGESTYEFLIAAPILIPSSGAGKIHMEFGAILIYGNSESEIYIWNFGAKLT